MGLGWKLAANMLGTNNRISFIQSVSRWVFCCFNYVAFFFFFPCRSVFFVSFLLIYFTPVGQSLLHSATTTDVKFSSMLRIVLAQPAVQTGIKFKVNPFSWPPKSATTNNNNNLNSGRIAVHREASQGFTVWTSTLSLVSARTAGLWVEIQHLCSI